MSLGQTFFRDTRPGEHVIAIIRRHWFILFRDIVGLVFLFVLPFFVVPLIGAVITQGSAVPVSGGVILFFASLWSLIIWNLLFFRWTDYYYDVWVLTTNRIIDIDQQGLFHRDIATLFDLNHIEDVKTTVYGIIGNLLNFGKIQVQTAAHRDEFVMDGIENPVHFEQLIREAQQRHMAGMLKQGAHPGIEKLS
jgi:hypothetical protein